MRKTLLASGALLGFAVALPALAQTGQMPLSEGNASQGVVGAGGAEPHSTRASNINAANTSSVIAPQLPVTAHDATPQTFLTDARQALQKHQTGKAQEALERAETRLLTRSTAPSAANTPYNGSAVSHIAEARQALGRHDVNAADQAIAMALNELPSRGASGMETPGGGSPMGGGTAPAIGGSAGTMPNEGTMPASGGMAPSQPMQDSMPQ